MRGEWRFPRLCPQPDQVRRLPEQAAAVPSKDRAWNTWVELDLLPNPELSAEQQAAVTEDFGLKAGRLRMKVREAMLPYTLDHLRLPGAHWPGKPFLVPSK